MADESSTATADEVIEAARSAGFRVTHDQLREGANNQLYGGWPMVLSGIKTLLETGELLTAANGVALGRQK